MKTRIQQHELVVLTAVIILLNWGLWTGRTCLGGIYDIQSVANGQWYRLLSAPFVHLSAYHLLLDGLAFVMLYASLPYASAAGRLLAVAAINAAVMIAVTLFPGGAGLGYCGLSGIDHGLMSLWCLEMMRQSDITIRWAGWAGFILTGGKCLLEAAGGQALFSGLHLGDVGVPIVSAHWAGFLGGLIVFGVGVAGDKSRQSRFC